MLQARTAKRFLTLPLAVGVGISMLLTAGGPLTAHASASVPTALGTIHEYAVPTLSSTPNGIAAGSDGNLWFTEYTSNKIGRITPAGVITEFSANQIGKITTSGTCLLYTSRCV